MILFASDYCRFPNTIIDYKTTNKSFLALAAKYHKAGYKNSLFILTLLNPKLQGVDPFSRTLTEEQKIDIVIEASLNPWYALREIIRLPATAGIEPVRFRASRGNIAATWSFCCDIDFILIQPRQTGKSVGIDCIMVWLLFMATDNTRISLITKDGKLRTANIERLQMIRDLLPSYMYLADKSDSSNKIGLTYNTRGNTYVTAVSQSSEAAATNVGRGMTSPIFHVDEAPFISHISTTLQAALAGGTAARAHAKEIGAPNCNIFTTTAGKKDSRDGKHIYGMIEGSAHWSEAFFDLANKVELHEVIYKNSSGIFKRIYMEFSHIQLGFDDQWLLEALATSGSTGEDADRDYFNRWTSGSLQSPLTVDLNEAIRDSKKEPLYTDINQHGYVINWYRERSILREYLQQNKVLMCMDTSEAIGCDDIGVIYQDIESLETIGAAALNETSMVALGNWVADQMIEYPNILLMVERKSTGLAIMDIVISRLMAVGINPFKRIYNTIVQDFAERKVEYADISSAANTRVCHAMVTKYRKYFGFITTAQSRHELYGNVLQNNAKLGYSRVNDDKLIGQITSLVTKNGRIDHASSGHDDMVIAWLLGGWFLSNGLNMEFYGIQPMKCLSRTAVIVNRTEDDVYLEEQVDRLRIELDEVKADLIVCRDPGRKMLLGGRLARLVDRSHILPESLSLAAIHAELEESTRLRHIGKRSRRH